MIYLELFYTFFKIGLFTFGGGYAMIPMIESEVIAKGWITDEMLINFLAISESTPGSFAINISTFIGESQAGVLGALAATLGVALPSFIIILIIFQFYKRFINNRFVLGFMEGLRAIVVGMIIGVAIDLIYKEFFITKPFTFDYVAFILFLILALISLGYKKILKKNISPIILIIIASVAGIITYGIVL